SAQLAGLPAGSCVPQQATPSVEDVFPFNPNTSNAFNPNLVNTTSSDNGIVKVDYQMNQQNRFSGMYYTAHQTGVAFGTAVTSPNWSIVTPNLISMYSGAWVWSPNSRWVNELRGGRAALDSQLRHIADSNLPSL